MTIENKIRAMAGTMILLSLGLSQIHSPWWLCLTAFVGLNLFQSAFTGFCPAENIFRKFSRNPQSGGCCSGGEKE